MTRYLSHPEPFIASYNTSAAVSALKSIFALLNKKK
uniref:Bm14250 n=1 Tax=Brugia malayi TaxID=6279 RepID=A0A0J9Y8I6_BRUMA|nr:Bm14250 [Brugia malayi]